MDKKIINKQKALVALFLLFIYAIILIFIAQSQGQDDLVLTLRQNPVFIFFLLFPICMWIFFLVRGNSNLELINFLKNNLLNYISKFMAFVITAYLAFFVLIPHRNGDFIDLIIELILVLSAFVLFLFACWFEESKNPPLNKKNLKSFTKMILKVSTSLMIPFIILFLTYYFIFSLNIISSFFVGFLQTVLLLGSLSPILKSKIKKYFALIFFLLIHAGMVFWMTHFQEFNLIMSQFYGSLIIGSILVVVGTISSEKFASEKWFKDFTEDLFY